MNEQPAASPAMTSAELYRAYAGFVARYVYRLGVPAALVEDVVQEVFVVAHVRGGYRPGPAKPTSYLATIAAHAASHARRSAGRHDARVLELRAQTADASESVPSDVLEARDTVSLVRAALADLPPELATTLVLADGEDEPCASIAAAMGVPVGTVYSRLHHARRKFSAAIESIEAQRAREESRMRPLASDSRAQAWARRMSVVFLLPFNGRAFEDTRAYALLRATRTLELEPFLDAAAGYSKHLASVARGAASPSWARANEPAAAAMAPLSGKKGTLGAKVLAGLMLGGTTAWLVMRAPGHNAEADELAGVQPHVPTPEAAHAPSAGVSIAPNVPADQPTKSPKPRESDHALKAQQTAPQPVRGAARPTSRSVGPSARPSHPVSTASNGASVATYAPTQRGRTAFPSESSPSSEPQPASEPQPRSEPQPPSASPAAQDSQPVSEPASAQPAQTPPEPAPAQTDPARARMHALRALATAERLAGTDPEQALTLIASLERAPEARTLAEEVAFVRLSAQFYAGNADATRVGAPAFLRRYPDSAFASRVRAMLSGGR